MKLGCQCFMISGDIWQTNILTPLFWRFHNQVVLKNCWFYGRQKVLLSVTALAMRLSFTGFAGKLPSSSHRTHVTNIAKAVYELRYHTFTYIHYVMLPTIYSRLCFCLKALCQKASILAYWQTVYSWSFARLTYCLYHVLERISSTGNLQMLWDTRFWTLEQLAKCLSTKSPLQNPPVKSPLQNGVLLV